MICAGGLRDVILPQNDLVYLAFRLSFFDVAVGIDLIAGQTGEDDDDEFGFLVHHVPFFRTVPPIVQLDLLAALWKKHHDEQLHEIYLAEAAVLYGIFEDAGRITTDEPEIISPWMKDGPRKIKIGRKKRLREKFEDLFDGFWGDIDFLMVDLEADGMPFHEIAAAAKLGIPKKWIDEMYDILGRARPHRKMTADLVGLLTDKEMAEYRSLLET